MSNKNRQKTKRSRTTSAISGTRNSNTIWIIAGLLLIVVVGVSACGYLQQNQSAPAASVADYPQEITVQEAAVKKEQGAFILDVREPDEWQEHHIPGSTLIPLGDLPNRLNEVPEDQEVIVVCRSGNRSRSGRDILLNAGFSTVTSMNGGLNDWRASGYETVSGP